MIEISDLRVQYRQTENAIDISISFFSKVISMNKHITSKELQNDSDTDLTNCVFMTWTYMHVEEDEKISWKFDLLFLFKMSFELKLK